MEEEGGDGQVGQVGREMGRRGLEGVVKGETVQLEETELEVAVVMEEVLLEQRLNMFFRCILDIKTYPKLSCCGG